MPSRVFVADLNALPMAGGTPIPRIDSTPSCRGTPTRIPTLELRPGKKRTVRAAVVSPGFWKPFNPDAWIDVIQPLTNRAKVAGCP